MLLAVRSPAYVASEWCRRELDTFADLIAAGERRSIFVVELDPDYETAHLPSLLADLKRAHFWVRDRKTGAARALGDPLPSGEYYCAVDDLVQDLVAELKQMKTARPRSATAVPLALNGAVFLADVTDDLDEQRSNIKRYLDQAGIAVLPKNSFSLHPEAFRQTVREGLAEADVFVQLLSDIPGKRPPDLPEGYVKCQLELARSLDRPILQWRSPTLDMATVQDNAQRALLDAPTVLAEGIEDFKREIRHRLEDRRTAPPRPLFADPFILVDRYSTDKPLAEQLCDILSRYDAGTMEPEDDHDPAKFREDLQNKLEECNALILIYGATPKSWVDEHLRVLQKMLTRRSRPLRGWAIVEGPPDPKDRLSVRLPRMRVIDCRAGIQEAEVKRFLESLGGGAA
jgi:hypothetical protein